MVMMRIDTGPARAVKPIGKWEDVSGFHYVFYFRVTAKDSQRMGKATPMSSGRMVYLRIGLSPMHEVKCTLRYSRKSKRQIAVTITLVETFSDEHRKLIIVLENLFLNRVKLRHR